MGRLSISRLVAYGGTELTGLQEIPDNSTLCNTLVQSVRIRFSELLDASETPEESEEVVEIMNDTVERLNLLMAQKGTSLEELFEKKRIASIEKMTESESHSYHTSPF